MLKKTKRIALIGGALAAVSFGGSALAAAGAAPVATQQVPVKVKAASAAEPQKAGDAETADDAGAVAQKGADAETADGATADQETADGPSSGQEADQETADDGGNAGAQHEAGGQSAE